MRTASFWLFSLLFVGVALSQQYVRLCGTYPSQIGLSLSTPTERRLRFVMFPPCGPTGINNMLPTQAETFWTNYLNSANFPTVLYGTVPGQYTNNATFVSTSTVANTWRWYGRHFRFVFPNLASGSTYYYAIRYNQTLMSKEFSFTIQNRAVTRIIAVGDIGQTDYYGAGGTVSTAVSKYILSNTVDFLVHAGDISYAMYGVQALADVYGNQIQNISALIPYMTSPGNHEEDDQGWEGYRKRWDMPTKPIQGYSGDVFWWSYDYNNVHIVSLSPYHDPEGAQKTWLINDLRNAQMADFRIVFFHEPLYSTNGGHGSNLTLRAQWESILQEYKVDLVINGHDHCYERTVPVYNGVGNFSHAGTQADPFADAPLYGSRVHVVVGNGGRRLTPFNATEDRPWSVVKNNFVYGFSVFDVFPNGTLVFNAYGTNNYLIDSFYITRTKAAPVTTGPVTTGASVSTTGVSVSTTGVSVSTTGVSVSTTGVPVSTGVDASTSGPDTNSTGILPPTETTETDIPDNIISSSQRLVVVSALICFFLVNLM